MLHYEGSAELIVGDTITRVVTVLILDGDLTVDGRWRARLLEVPGWLGRGLARGEDRRCSLRFGSGRQVEFSTERYDTSSSWLVVVGEGSLPPEVIDAPDVDQLAAGRPPQVPAR